MSARAGGLTYGFLAPTWATCDVGSDKDNYHRRRFGNCFRRQRSSVTKFASRARHFLPTCTYTAVSIIPTGVGAAIGGYAGDGLPAARLLSQIAGRLITHPNVLNGALMYWPIENALYVEGAALDDFAAGYLGLQLPSPPTNKIGLVLDASLSEDARIRHLQVADAARATLGVQVEAYAVTDEPLGVQLAQAESNNASWGTLSRPDSLLRAARHLIENAGVDAIAIVGKFPDDEDEELLASYRSGSGVDAIAGAEAVISHLVTRELCIPCAHAPSLPPLDADASVSPKAAAEELGYTFLSCVLVGLSRAPRLIDLHSDKGRGTGPSWTGSEKFVSRTAESGDVVTAKDVNALVIPKNAFGGAAVLSLAARPDVLIVSVENNSTVLNVPPRAVGILENRVVSASSYAEAAGFLAAHKAGIDIKALGVSVPHIARI